ncbi:MAG: hypothetical protein WCI46_15835 [Verrucomicrobiota bacterium]
MTRREFVTNPVPVIELLQKSGMPGVSSAVDFVALVMEAELAVEPAALATLTRSLDRRAGKSQPHAGP